MPEKWFFFVVLAEQDGYSDAYFALAREHSDTVFHLPHLKASSLQDALAALETSWGIAPTSTPVPLGTVCYKWRERNPEMVGANPEMSEEGEVYHLPTYRLQDPLPKGLPRGSFFPAPNPPNVPVHDRLWVERAVLLDTPFHCNIPMFFRELVS